MNIHEANAYLESIQEVFDRSKVQDVLALIDERNRLMLDIQKPRDYEDRLTIVVEMLPEEGGFASFLLEVISTGYDGKDRHVKSYRQLNTQSMTVVMMYWISEQEEWCSQHQIVKDLAKLIR